MISNISLKHIRLTKRLKKCLMCTETKPIKTPSEVESNMKFRKDLSGKYLEEAQNFLEKNPKTRPFKDILPVEIQEQRTYNKPAHLYLICPDIAGEIAKYVCERVLTREVIAETNPGLALISQELLKNEFKKVILYERNAEFYKLLQEKFENDNRVTLHNKNVFYLRKYEFQDKLDQEKRVESMFKNVPKKNWSEDPFLTVIGTMTNIDFMRHLVKSVILQSNLTVYGRFDLFLLTYQSLYNTIKGKKGYTQVSWHYLFEMLFKVEYIDKFPRQYFLPWERTKPGDKGSSIYDLNHIYFIRVTMKEELPISPSELVPFFCFLSYLYRHGTSSVIATCEKWLPDCGETLLIPKLKNEDYYNDLNVFTKFNKLNLTHTIALYREFSNHPNFKSSPFMSMVEAEWVKSETIETTLNEALSKNIQTVSSQKRN